MANVGSLSSLGLGSNQVLNNKLLDDLRAADDKIQIAPLDRKLEANLTKKKDLSAIDVLMRGFKTSISTLSNELTYLGRQVSKNGDSATLTADAGSDVQKLNIDVKKLATKDTYQGAKLENANTALAQESAFSSGKIKLKTNGKEFDIQIKDTYSLKDIAEAIKKETSGQINAKVMNVGGDKPFQLILQSKDSGEKNAISIEAYKDTKTPPNASIEENSNKILKALGWSSEEITLDDGTKTTQLEQNHITKAQDAEFVYDGVTLKRSENTIKDLKPGITLELQKEGITNFNVTQDMDKISKNMQEFAENYNKLMGNLKIATDFNSETGNAGTFQGSREIIEIRSQINKILISANEEGKSLLDSGSSSEKLKFGFKLNEDGVLSFDKSVLQETLNKDPQTLERYFRGGTKYEPIQYSSNQITTSGAINVTDDKLKINGKSITFSTNATASIKDNAQALAEAINNANLDIRAVISDNENGVILSRKDGGDIKIDGDDAILKSLGLSKTNIQARGNKVEGFFSQLDSKMDSFLNSQNGSLTAFDKELTDTRKQIEEEKAKTQKFLDDRYDIMRQKFAAYDTMIAKLNTQFNTLKTMIDAQLNAK